MTLYSAAGSITAAEYSAKWPLEKGEVTKRAAIRRQENMGSIHAAVDGTAVKTVFLGRLSRKLTLVISKWQLESSGISR